MKFTRVLALAVLAGQVVLGADRLMAQSGAVPAEFPPASYKSNQYVDSRGCAFIRAGIDGNTTWVPRMTRARKPVCGLKPSLARGATSATAPAPRQSDKVVVITNDQPPATNESNTAPRGTRAATATAEAQPQGQVRAPAATTRRTATARAVTTTTTATTATTTAAAPTRRTTTTTRVRPRTAQAAPSPAPAPTVVRRTAPAAVAAAPVPTATAAPAAARRPASQGLAALFGTATPSPASGPTIFKTKRAETAAPRPAPTPRRVVVRRAAQVAAATPSPAPQPTRIVKQAVPRVQRSATAQLAGRLPQTPCPGVNGISARYLGTSGMPVRCGPQQVFEVVSEAAPVLATGSVARSQTASGASRNVQIVPRHVYEARVANGPLPAVPNGYRRVWDDDRLNPRRAQGTLAGVEQMELVWTTTVPRRLIDRNSGRDVTHKHTLIYPFTDPSMQRAYLASNGRFQVQVAPNSGNVRLVEGDTGRVAVISSKSAVRKPGRSKMTSQRVATRSVAPKATKPKPVSAARAVRVGKGHRYVQVGVFGDAGNADRTIRRLHGLGLPVAKSQRKTGGRTLTVVVAGPFGNARALAGGLQRVRGAGFADAYTR